MVSIQLLCEDASRWSGGPVDMVLTNPYAALPHRLWGKPMIISLHHPIGSERDGRIRKAEDWIGGGLAHLSDWGPMNAVYVHNLPVRLIDLRVLDVDAEDAPPNVGWFPFELPLRLLILYCDLVPKDATIWDGFCGRGTVGRACRRMGYNYIGIDIDPARIALARRYLGEG